MLLRSLSIEMPLSFELPPALQSDIFDINYSNVPLQIRHCLAAQILHHGCPEEDKHSELSVHFLLVAEHACQTHNEEKSKLSSVHQDDRNITRGVLNMNKMRNNKIFSVHVEVG